MTHTAENDATDDAEWEAEVARAERGSPGIRRWLAYQDRKAARVIPSVVTEETP
jgi:hypothetical protein